MKSNSDEYVFEKLQRLLEEKFSLPFSLLELRTDFEKDLGFDSRDFFEFLEYLEQEFEIELNFDKVDYLLKNNKLNTLKDIIFLINYSKIKN